MKEKERLSLKEINGKIINLRNQLLNLRLSKKTKRLKKTHLLVEIKKEIARYETILNLNNKKLLHNEKF